MFNLIIRFRPRDNPDQLDDKSHLDQMKDRYARLGIVEDITDGEYDDEYDDTYDDGGVNVQDRNDNTERELPKNENRSNDTISNECIGNEFSVD
jgi:hypothetical protein